VRKLEEVEKDAVIKPKNRRLKLLIKMKISASSVVKSVTSRSIHIYEARAWSVIWAGRAQHRLECVRSNVLDQLFIPLSLPAALYTPYFKSIYTFYDFLMVLGVVSYSYSLA